MNDLEVCWWPTEKPIPYARNSRKIPPGAIDKVAASLKEFGWRQPIAVDKEGVIICGHTRLLAGSLRSYRLMNTEARPTLLSEGRTDTDIVDTYTPCLETPKL